MTMNAKARSRALVVALVLGAAPAAAEPAAAEPAYGAERSIHGTMALGAGVALGGPAGQGYGVAAELEMFPGGALGRFGAGVYYRDFAGSGGGVVAAGVTFAAGATRPHLVMTLHGEAGVEYGRSVPVAGGGVRAQLGLWQPLALGANATAHLFIEGADSRLSLAWTVTLGVGW
jgi:hypothetical protein